MTRRPSPYAATLATLATTLLMPLILSLSPMADSALPIPMAVNATVGVTAGQLV